MNRQAAVHGLLAGISLVALKYAEIYAGLDKGEYANYMAFLPLVLLAVFIVMAQLDKRRSLDGQLSFGDGLKVGLGAAAVCALVFAIGNYAYYKWYDTTLVYAQVPQLEEYYRKEGRPDSEIGEMVKDYIATYPFRAAILSLAQIIAFGAVISLVSAVVVKRK